MYIELSQAHCIKTDGRIDLLQGVNFLFSVEQQCVSAVVLGDMGGRPVLCFIQIENTPG